MSRGRVLHAAGVAVLFAALTLVATWPQGRQLASTATPHQDVFFNMWRLRWVAHALITPSAHLFDANIFSPEPRALAFSDAMLVEGVIAAPMLWAGARPVLVHNLMLLGAMVSSAMAMFALVRYLTGSRGAGVIGGVVFAFAPYRFEHFMHMELQWAMWMPLAFLAMHRTFDTGKWKYGVATGACIGLQVLSCIYYGIFLATLLPVAALLLLLNDAAVPRTKVLRALAAGAAFSMLAVAIYAGPYMATRATAGERSLEETIQFSARPSSYRAATSSNWLYGGNFAVHAGDERRLFPGLIPLLLAMIGLLLRVPGARPIVYLLLLAAAFEMSLGVRGYSYPFLYRHLSAYHALRALGRLGIFVLLCLGVLAGYGYTYIVAGRPAGVRIAVAGALVAGLLAEYHLTLTLRPFTNTAPPLYRFLAVQPRGVVAEFPMPAPDNLPGPDAEYSYMSTFHWFPLVNGYSGTYPPSYLGRLERARDFPGAPSIDQLRRDNVRYVVVHSAGYPPKEWEALQPRLNGHPDLTQLGRFDDGNGAAMIYRLR